MNEIAHLSRDRRNALSPLDNIRYLYYAGDTRGYENVQRLFPGTW